MTSYAQDILYRSVQADYVDRPRNAARRFPQDVLFDSALGASAKIDIAHQLGARVTDDFVGGKIREIVLVSSRLVSMISQKPEVRTLVPISTEKQEATSGPRGPACYDSEVPRSDSARPRTSGQRASWAAPAPIRS